MKIEIGESLVYSWFRHIKECQLTQTNWKTSPNWTLNHKTEIEAMYDELKLMFGSGLFKKTASVDQLLRQGECDVFGMNFNNGDHKYYAADVAYHEQGLNYGSKNETIMKVISKCIRTAFCLYGYFDASDGEVIFASPKITKGINSELVKHFVTLNDYFTKKGISYKFELIGNDDFGEMMFTTLAAVTDASDTSELLVRSYKLIKMFASAPKTKGTSASGSFISISTPSAMVFDKMKVGAMARGTFRDILEKGKVTKSEVLDLQDKDYCKKIFNINHPILVEEGTAFDKLRYYSDVVTIKKKNYYMCNDWYERNRKALQTWIENHS